MARIVYESLILEEYGDGYIVAECNEEATSVVIPALVNGKTVEGISDNAFENCDKLVEVVFPSDEELLENGIRFEIGGNAFMGCTALKRIEIPEAVCTVGHGAFYHCHALEEAILPSRGYIAPYAFADCRSLVSVSPIRCISEGIFSDCASLKELPVLAVADEIDEYAFEGCESLTEIVIPASVTSIGSQAFRGCANLKSVTFESPENWESLYVYKDKYFDLNLLDPEKNARILSTMDFDDGCGGWRKKPVV